MTRYADAAEMSFREMSAWACLGSILAVYVPYFVIVYRMFDGAPWRGGLLMGRVLEAMVTAIVLQSVLTAVAMVCVSLRFRPGTKDERDVIIEARSFRYAYRVLVGLLLTLVLFVPACVAERSGHITAFPFITQTVWLAFVAGEAVKYLVRAMGYRRGR